MRPRDFATTGPARGTIEPSATNAGPPRPLVPADVDALKRATHQAHDGANRAQRRHAARRYRRYVTRPVAPGALVET